MSHPELLSLIDAEISRLNAARILLDELPKRQPGSPKSTTIKSKRKKPNLTPEGRARIAAAVKARWANQKKVAK